MTQNSHLSMYFVFCLIVLCCSKPLFSVETSKLVPVEIQEVTKWCVVKERVNKWYTNICDQLISSLNHLQATVMCNLTVGQVY